MAQSDQVVQNATFPTVRADINDNLAALYSQSSGPSAPTTTVAFQPWVDTSSSPPVWKIRNSANTGWITVGVLDPAGFESGGVTPIANGGTGEITAAAAIAALLPSQGGNANKALITTGTSLLWGNAISSTFTKYETTGTFTWTKPAGVTTVIVFCWGGGGGGGKHATQGGGGGAGASCVITALAAADLGSSETVTVGAGGAGKTGGNGSGGNGGNSSFGSYVTGYGGLGGTGNGSQTVSIGSTAYGIGSTTSFAPSDAIDIFAGGDGGRSIDAGTSGQGKRAIFGGGGGGGVYGPSAFSQPGGISVLGGNGGASAFTQATDGAQPGGGGGATEDTNAGSGGDGAVWVITL
jgi:hypothetical protein